MNEPLIYVYTYIDTGLKIYIRPANVALSFHDLTKFAISYGLQLKMIYKLL